HQTLRDGGSGRDSEVQGDGRPRSHHSLAFSRRQTGAQQLAHDPVRQRHAGHPDHHAEGQRRLQLRGLQRGRHRHRGRGGEHDPAAALRQQHGPHEGGRPGTLGHHHIHQIRQQRHQTAEQEGGGGKPDRELGRHPLAVRTAHSRDQDVPDPVQQHGGRHPGVQ
ncbi:hypothetical protein M9458_031193, partial [Cirrhinus mrigala]